MSAFALTLPLNSNNTGSSNSFDGFLLVNDGLPVTVNDGTNTILDGVDYLNHTAVKWMINLTDVNNTVIQTNEIMANHTNSVINFNNFSMLGSISNVAYSVSLITGYMALTVINNSGQTLYGNVVRMQFSKLPTDYNIGVFEPGMVI